MATRSVVTFLFTDIEGSTRIWEDHTDKMEFALARHDALLRRAIESRGGIVFKTVGDAFCAVFTAASDCVLAAVAGQLALQEEPWPSPIVIRARMAIHTGECTQRNDDYFGPTVNRVARLLAIGHGGQVLVSASARLTLGEHLPPAVRLRDLGEHRLKDLGRPEQVFEVCAAGLVDTTRPLRSVDKRRDNLPAPVTTFVGREIEMGEIRELLLRHRLVTVVGTGGCGKTRLALRVAENLVGGSEDGVWFVELASLRDPELLASAIATALDVRSEGARDLAGELAKALHDRQLVLVLDNCEHLLEACAALVYQVLRSCAGVTVLATSREPLSVDGEAVYWLRSLTVPEPGERDPARLVGFESVQLLVDRISMQQPRFAVDGTNAVAVADICRRLDGIPLALELVAGRAGSLTLEELRDRLDERFRLLTHGSRTAQPRQRTLRALIDWSYDLLSTAEQRVLARCSVFAGTFDTDAAEDVCGRDPIGVSEVDDYVIALNAKSLLQRDEASGSTRFRLLETVRHYAAEQLLPLEGELEATRMAHCDHYVELAERTEAQLYGPRQREAFERLAADLDNFRAALKWSSERPERGERGLRLAGALAQVWFTCRPYREGLDQTTKLLSIATAPSAVRAKALWSAGLLASVLGEGDSAQSLLDEALELARQAADRSLVARCLDLLGLLAFFRNDLTCARRLLEESVADARAIDDRWCLADALGTLGSILPLVGELELAEKISGEALAIARDAQDAQGTRMALFGIALTASRLDDLATLRDAAGEGLEICRSLGDAWFTSYFLWLLATASVQLGDVESARAQAEESLALARLLEGPLLIVCALEAVAAVDRAVGNATSAASALEEARRVGSTGSVPGAYLSAVTCALGELAVEAGHTNEGATLLAEAAEVARAVGDSWGLARAVATLNTL
ncbi:MAG: adenylate/guanylate cyclase domain-containing protein [Acidimicrobiales bacterium]